MRNSVTLLCLVAAGALIAPGDDPNDPQCEWDRDNTQTCELPFPKESICFEDV